MNTDLEAKFHGEMMDLYDRAKRELGYNGARFLEMVSSRGGLAAAKSLLASPHAQEGLARLWELGHLELSAEAVAIREPWRALFTPKELAEAEKRLQELGYEEE